MKKVVELNVNLVMFLDYCVNITLMYIFFLWVRTTTQMESPLLDEAKNVRQ